MNTHIASQKEPFIIGSSNLMEYENKLTKLNFGMLMFCEKGEATITIDLNEYHIVQNTNIILIPGSIITIKNATPDFKIVYFIFSTDMFRTACFRLEPAFFQFISENPCYTPKQGDELKPLKNLIKGGEAIYNDRENKFREDIAQSLLQIFIWDTYDKVQRLFTPEQINGSNRKEELFKKFIGLVHHNCTQQRDVAWYANELCISSRYLASIVREITKQGTAKDIIDKFIILELRVALQTTNLSIKEIADQFNFPDQSFLGRYFKKHMGMSPKEFRQQKDYSQKNEISLCNLSKL